MICLDKNTLNIYIYIYIYIYKIENWEIQNSLSR